MMINRFTYFSINGILIDKHIQEWFWTHLDYLFVGWLLTEKNADTSELPGSLHGDVIYHDASHELVGPL